MKFIGLISFFIIFKANAFTLNNNASMAFGHDEVQVNVASGFCTNLGINDSELLSIVSDAVEFWNHSPTSRIKLREGNLTSVSANYHTGLICNTGTSCDPNPTLAVSNDILLSCNNNATNFPSSGVLAVTVPNNYTSSTIIGSLVMLNDLSTNQFQSKSRDEKVAIIAHELGHAIGLGHSPVRDSLMYYAVVPLRRSLGQDDIDGITYLYPKQQPISCGTITDNKPNMFWPGIFIGFALSLLAAYALKLRPRITHSRS